MKKVFIFASLALVVLISSCSTNEEKTVQQPVANNFVFTANFDTCISVKVPILNPIRLCAGGYSKYPKVTTWKDSSICLKKGQAIDLSNEEMNQKGWYYFPSGTKAEKVVTTTDNTTTSYPWVWPLIVALLLLVIFFPLWEIAKNYWRKKGEEKEEAHSTTSHTSETTSSSSFTKDNDSNHPLVKIVNSGSNAHSDGMKIFIGGTHHHEAEKK